jgi:hypothetical protein
MHIEILTDIMNYDTDVFNTLNSYNFFFRHSRYAEAQIENVAAVLAKLSNLDRFEQLMGVYNRTFEDELKQNLEIGTDLAIGLAMNVMEHAAENEDQTEGDKICGYMIRLIRESNASAHFARACAEASYKEFFPLACERLKQEHIAD